MPLEGTLYPSSSLKAIPSAVRQTGFREHASRLSRTFDDMIGDDSVSEEGVKVRADDELFGEAIELSRMGTSIAFMYHLNGSTILVVVETEL